MAGWRLARAGGGGKAASAAARVCGSCWARMRLMASRENAEAGMVPAVTALSRTVVHAGRLVRVPRVADCTEGGREGHAAMRDKAVSGEV